MENKKTDVKFGILSLISAINNGTLTDTIGLGQDKKENSLVNNLSTAQRDAVIDQELNHACLQHQLRLERIEKIRLDSQTPNVDVNHKKTL